MLRTKNYLAIAVTLAVTAMFGQTPKPATDDPKSLRDNEFYTTTTMLIARDICSDHSGDTKVWILDYRLKLWVSITCDQWAYVSTLTDKPKTEATK